MGYITVDILGNAEHAVVLLRQRGERVVTPVRVRLHGHVPPVGVE